MDENGRFPIAIVGAGAENNFAVVVVISMLAILGSEIGDVFSRIIAPSYCGQCICGTSICNP